MEPHFAVVLVRFDEVELSTFERSCQKFTSKVSPSPDEVSRDEKTDCNLRTPHFRELWKSSYGRRCERFKADSAADEYCTHPRPLGSPSKTEIAVER